MLASGLTEAAYLALVLRLDSKAQGPVWPRRRIVFFTSGLLVVAGALTGPLSTYASLFLSVHMGQHMLLQMVAPPLLLLGAPITLLLRSDPPWVRRQAVLSVLRSRTMKVVTHPVTTFAAFAGSLVLTHLSPFYEATLTNEPVHVLEHILFLGTGLLFWLQVVDADPLPHRQGAPARLLYLFLAMPVMALVGSVLAESSAPLYHYYASLPPPWGPQALTDQHRAGAMMWEFGIFVIAPVMGRTLMRWLEREERDQSRYELSANLRQQQRTR